MLSNIFKPPKAEYGVLFPLDSIDLLDFLTVRSKEEASFINTSAGRKAQVVFNH